MSPACTMFVLPHLHYGVGLLAADLMLALRADGERVLLITSGAANGSADDAALVDRCRDAGVVIETADVSARDTRARQAAAARVGAAAARHGATVAHAFTAMSAAAANVPVVQSAVGWSPHKPEAQRREDAAIMERAAVATAVSEAVAAELRAAGLRRTDLRVISNGVRTTGAVRAARPVRTIGAMGQMIDRKGFDVLIGALARERGASLSKVIMAGEGEARPALEARARAAGVAGLIEWRGHTAVDGFLAEIDLLVVPSRSDALPMILLQAMAAGVPVVASRAGGIGEALTDDCGWTVPPGDPAALAAALAAAAADPHEAAHRARRAMARVDAHYGLPRMVADYRRCYEAARARPWRTAC